MGEDGAVGEEEGAMQKVRRSKFEVRIRKCGAADDDVLAVVGGVGGEHGGGGIHYETHQTHENQTRTLCRKRTQRSQRERSGSFFEVFEFFAANLFPVWGFGSRVHSS